MRENPPIPIRTVAVTACVAMVSAPHSPPSPLHCAGPVAMVTGLSDRWPSYRHGVLNSPTASPLPPSASPWSSAATEGRSKPLAFTLSLCSLSVHALCPIACCRFIQKEITSSKGASTCCCAGPIQTTGTERSWTRTYTHISSIVSAPAKSGIAGLATHQQNSVMSSPHPPEVCSSMTSCWLMQCVSTVTHRARRARTRWQNT